MYNRILIANRGEIALRVMRACRELGIETVAIFSEGDRGAEYLKLADEAFCVGGARSTESYLKIDRIISTAEVSGADAVHPGYGFLSENAHFNEVCRDCNIDFIGPSPEAMSRLGDKNQARDLARSAGVPVVPGSEGLIENEQHAIETAKEIGFPVLIKATAGGGGKGMRLAENEKQMSSAYQQAVTEAGAAFGNAGVYIEKFVVQPRHVEVQILADTHGNAVHLWERDCSTQRRHQKLIEESPSPRLPDDARSAICEAAVRLVQHANYYNAGTVEFIVDKENNFYFIEVNARISSTNTSMAELPAMSCGSSNQCTEERSMPRSRLLSRADTAANSIGRPQRSANISLLSSNIRANAAPTVPSPAIPTLSGSFMQFSR